MDNIFSLLILFFVISFSSATFADSYPAHATTTVYYVGSANFTTLAACSAALTDTVTTRTCIADSDSSGHVDCYWNDTGAQCAWSTAITILHNYDCPNGGELSGQACINALPCVVPEVRNSNTGQCGQPPPDCLPPESDDGFGGCAVKECTGGQHLNVCTGSCETAPVCGSTETLNICTNLCELKPLNCPVHSHANYTNDACLPDPPLTCPTGQHDDGTYKCIADDAVGCTSDQYKGYIMGVPQCINKTNAAEFARNAALNAQRAADASSAASSADQAASSANSAAAADPSNASLQTAAATATSNAVAAHALADSAASDSAASKSSSDSAQLESISQNTMSTSDSSQKTYDYITDSTAPALDGQLPAPVDAVINNGSITVGGSSSCPAAIPLNLSFGSMSMTMQPICDLATATAPFFIALCSLISGFIIFGGVRD